MSCAHKHPESPAPTANLAGKRYWRSLEELSGTPEFEAFLQREFPNRASEWIERDGVNRRIFLKLMGASLALAGLNTGCSRQPEEAIVPYVVPPEQVTPGQSMYFATTIPVFGFGRGVIVESREGRPIKVEGNPDHPSSLGATDAWAQASLLSLYDPDRSQNVRYSGQISTWATFVSAIRGALEASGNGAGVRLLTETVTSPTLIGQILELLRRYPEARWHQHDPCAAEFQTSALYRFDRAQRVLSLDSDFLLMEPGSLAYARQFINARRLRKASDGTAYRELAAKIPADNKRAAPDAFLSNRLYVVETMLSITGAMADHRLAAKPSRVVEIARAVAARIGVAGAVGQAGGEDKWIAAVADDLVGHRGVSIVIAGSNQPPEVHRLARAINAALGNIGTTVDYLNPGKAEVQIHSLAPLAREMESGAVNALLILGGNPVYTAPADLGFAEKLDRVALRIHLSPYYDETSFHCHWHVPESHWLESWGDLRGHDGTASLVQPLIAPLYATKTAHEVLAALLGSPEQSGYEVVRAHWRTKKSPGGF